MRSVSLEQITNQYRKHKEEQHHTYDHASEQEIKERIKAKDKNDLIQIISLLAVIQYF